MTGTLGQVYYSSRFPSSLEVTSAQQFHWTKSSGHRTANFVVAPLRNFDYVVSHLPMHQFMDL
jgi:hypothetical protein